MLAERTLLADLKAGGLVKGDIDEMMKVRLGAIFQPHGLGHLLGLDVHDVGGFPAVSVFCIEGSGVSWGFNACYRYIHELLPKYFYKNVDYSVPHLHLTRQVDQLRIPSVRHEFARNGISYRYPIIYNNLSENFKNFKDKISTHSLFGFKFYIKTAIIQSYKSECHIPDCYNCQNS